MSREFRFIINIISIIDFKRIAYKNKLYLVTFETIFTFRRKMNLNILLI